MVASCKPAMSSHAGTPTALLRFHSIVIVEPYMARRKADLKRLREVGRGRRARSPHHMPAAGWKDVLRRVFNEIQNDRIMLVAGGATFYMLLALFPALTAFVSIYGIVLDPVTIADHIAFLGSFLPRDGMNLIAGQLRALAQAKTNALSFGFVAGLLVALWSANSGMKTLFEAMNIVFEEREKRSFLKLNLMSLTFTIGGIVLAGLMVTVVGVIPALLTFARLGSMSDVLVSVLRWPALMAVIVLAMLLLYRYGPSRENSKWRWQLPGAVLATLVWMLASVAFSWYLTHFANYNATYGSLGAVIGFLMWTWISIMILLIGAEVNAELEHQTGEDSTTGPPEPLGRRGARMADTLGKSFTK